MYRMNCFLYEAQGFVQGGWSFETLLFQFIAYSNLQLLF